MNSTVISFIYMAIIFVVFIAIIFVPDRRRKKKYSEMLGSLKVNDNVETIGGMVGKLIHMDDEYVTIQTGPDKIKLKFKKSSIAAKINQD
jgi:preprotein translocase subunit YajC